MTGNYIEKKSLDKMKGLFLKTTNYNKRIQGFSGGAVVKNPPANAGDMGLSPVPGRSHMPRSS